MYKKLSFVISNVIQLWSIIVQKEHCSTFLCTQNIKFKNYIERWVTLQYNHRFFKKETKNCQKEQNGRCTMMLAVYREQASQYNYHLFKKFWLFWHFLLTRNIVHLPPIQMKGGSCTMFLFLHVKVGNIVQLPFFHLIVI